MTRRLLSMAALLAFSLNSAYAQFQCSPEEVLPDNAFPVVVLETSEGNVEVELNRMRAPASVNNFLSYVVEGAYDNTIFHRVIEGFVVQGGGFNEAWEEVEAREPVMNESGNGLSNIAWTIAMARYDDPHTGSNGFYFNVADNSQALDPSPRRWGYAVFGTVISGQEVLAAIAKVPTGYNASMDYQDVPITPVHLRKVTVK